MTYTQDQLNEIISKHAMWLRLDNDGVRANMSGADLSGANLSGANLSRALLSGANLSGANLSRALLSGANLSGADLSGAYLSSANLSGADLSGADLNGADLNGADLSGADLIGSSLHKWAQVAWNGHGEIGRMLTAFIQSEGDEAMYQCGCFYGTKSDLKWYIHTHDERHAASRTRALEIVTELINN